MNLNSLDCDFPAHHDQDHNKTGFASDRSSLSCVPYHIFFGSSQDHMRGPDHCRFLHPQHESDESIAFSQGGSSSSETENNVENGLKLTLWTMEDQGHVDHQMISKSIKRIEKMRKPADYIPVKKSSPHTAKHEDQKTKPSLDQSSGNNSSPTRVCVDCNTSKTPLWRSGPKGPKSLCNACGIRQRKSLRAAAATSNVMAASADQPKAIKIKVQHKEGSAKNQLVIKRRRRNTATDLQIGIGQKKLCFEDFLVTLSKSLSLKRVFPDDEKDAAILLMALSSGLVHG